MCCSPQGNCVTVVQVDWCESHQLETIRSNMLGALTLADVAQQRGVHVTYFGTGCIYTYDDVYPMGYAVKETDPPNFSGSFYSRTKGARACVCACVCVCLRVRVCVCECTRLRA